MSGLLVSFEGLYEYRLFSTGKKQRVRLSTPERWELQQMRGAGVMAHMDMPDFDEEAGILKNYDDGEEKRDVYY